MKIARLYCSLFFTAALTLVAATPTRAQSAAEANYPAWAALSHKLEANPLDPQLNRDAELAVQQIRASSDFHTPLCNSFFSFFSKLSATAYPYQPQVYHLYTLGSATYRIETGKTDAYGTNLYAFTSVLKGYSSILAKDPAARDKTMDELLVTDLKGKLPDMLGKDSTCRPGK